MRSARSTSTELLDRRVLLSGLEVDVGFGEGGLIHAAESPNGSLAVVPLSKGKTLVATSASALGRAGPVLLRFDAAGVLDPTFGDAGRVKVEVDSVQVRDAVVQPDGKIVFLGDAYNEQTFHFDYSLIRVNPNGSLDASFGTAGVTKIDGWVSASAPPQVAIGPDGSILVCGKRLGGPTVCKLKPRGTLDSSFADAGFFPFPNLSLMAPYDIAVDSLDRIVVCGGDTGGFSSNFIGRLTPSGQLDSSFAELVSQSFFVQGVYTTIAVQPDDKIIVANNNGFLSRLLTSGSPDSSWIEPQLDGSNS